MTLASFRLAIQLSNLPTAKSRAVSKAFDEKVDMRLHLDTRDPIMQTGLWDFLNQRGEQCHALIMGHLDQLRAGNTEQLSLALTLKFEQFCLNEGKEGKPIVLTDCFTAFPIQSMGNAIWARSFWPTLKLLNSFRIS